MKVKKTVGFLPEGDVRKSYTIHTECGQEFIASANGYNKGYRCEGLYFGSVKAIKVEIEMGMLTKARACKDERVAANSNKSPMWDCVHPCALLIKTQDPFLVISPEILQTLDNYGWLDDAGQMDIVRADREIKRVCG